MPLTPSPLWLVALVTLSVASCSRTHSLGADSRGLLADGRPVALDLGVEEAHHGVHDEHSDPAQLGLPNEGHHEEESHGHMVGVLDENQHTEDESPGEHMMLVWGAGGQIIEEELGYMFRKLSHCEVREDQHEGHGHDNHGQIITPRDILEEFGHEGTLDEQALLQACPTLLSCQLDDECTFDDFHEESSEGKSDVVPLKIIASVVLFLEVIVGGMVPVIVGRFEKLNLWHSLLNTFSGGIFMGAAFIHMLPEVHESQLKVQGLNGYPLGGMMVVVGFLLIFLIEHIICDVHGGESCKSGAGTPVTQNPIKAVTVLARGGVGTQAKSQQSQIWGGLVLLLAISVHSMFEAIALGLEEDKTSVLLLFATVGSHKGVAAMALSARFVRDNTPTKRVMAYVLLFALVAPVGILICVWATGVPQIVLLILDGLSAGTFIYIGAYEVVCSEFGEKHSKVDANQHRFIKYIAVVCGVLLIAMLQLVPHKHHH